MKHKLLVFCDAEEDYAQHMTEYLRRKDDFPWEVRVYTQMGEVKELGTDIDVLLIAESAYETLQEEICANQIIVLCENGIFQKDRVVSIDKYQSAERIKQKLLELYGEKQVIGRAGEGGVGQVKIIGMYSPVRRCLQTTFALTYGQLLAEKHKTLYLSFEYYGERQEWTGAQEDGLSKLLYFLQEENSFLAHVRTSVRKLGNLDYVAPMINGEKLLYVTLQEWQTLLKKLSDSGAYEYIVLDLSENMQGLFQVLRLCDRVYTIVKDDMMARCKVNQYEQLLALQEYEDVKRKTAKYVLPVFRKLPCNIEQYTKGELADYVRELLYKEESA